MIARTVGMLETGVAFIALAAVVIFADHAVVILIDLTAVVVYSSEDSLLR